MAIPPSPPVSSWLLFLLLATLSDAPVVSLISPIAMSSPDPSDKVMALNVRFVVKPDRRDDFLEAIRRDQQETLTKEPGALQFVVGQSVEDPCTFLLHEQYKTSSDLDVSTPHFADFVRFLKTEPLTQDHAVDRYICRRSPQVVAHRSGAYCLNVESCIKPELRDEFLALMARHQSDSLAEPLCLQFDWGESPTESNSFYIHEQYQNKEGYDAHEATSHFDRFMNFNKDNVPYSKPQIVSFYTTLEPSSS